MANREMFSKRQKRARGEVSDVLQYDNLPATFRRQVIFIWISAVGASRGSNFEGYPRSHEPNLWWEGIYNYFREEKGVFNLANPTDHPFVQLQHYLMEESTENALDLIEETFRFVDV